MMSRHNIQLIRSVTYQKIWNSASEIQETTNRWYICCYWELWLYIELCQVLAPTSLLHILKDVPISKYYNSTNRDERQGFL